MCVNKPLLPIGLLVGSWGSGGGFFFSIHFTLTTEISLWAEASSSSASHRVLSPGCINTQQTWSRALRLHRQVIWPQTLLQIFLKKENKNLILKMRLRDLKISYFSLLHWVSPSHGCFPASAARAGRDCANFPSSLASSIQQIPPWRAFNSSRPQLLIVLVHSSPSCCQLRACWPTSSVSLFILG